LKKPIDLSNFGLNEAKILATLVKFFDFEPRSITASTKLFERYKKHRIEADSMVSVFDEHSVDFRTIRTNRDMLEKHSLFYSYCFDHYKFLPVIMAMLGYKVSVLIEDRIRNKQVPIFDNIIKTLSRRTGMSICVDFLTDKDPNVILRMRSKANSNHKIIVFVDGNKGGSDKEDNLLKCRFKGEDILFRQGFGLLCHSLHVGSVCNVMCRKGGGGLLTIDTSEYVLESTTEHGRVYVEEVSRFVVKHLENVITLENIHKWDALVSLYQWLPNGMAKENGTSAHIPFEIDNEYYLLNSCDFSVRETDKKTFREIAGLYE